MGTHQCSANILLWWLGCPSITSSQTMEIYRASYSLLYLIVTNTIFTILCAVGHINSSWMSHCHSTFDSLQQFVSWYKVMWLCVRVVGGVDVCQSRLHAPSILSKLIATVHLETKLWNRPCNGIGLTYQVLIMSDSHSMVSKQRCDGSGPQSYFITHKYQWDVNGEDAKTWCCRSGKQNVRIPARPVSREWKRNSRTGGCPAGRLEANRLHCK